MELPREHASGQLQHFLPCSVHATGSQMQTGSISLQAHVHPCMIRLQPNVVGAAAWVVHGSGLRSRERPLIPHLASTHASPHAHLDDLPSAHRQRVSEGEKQREPGQHAGRVSVRVDAHVCRAVQARVKVASQAVDHA